MSAPGPDQVLQQAGQTDLVASHAVDVLNTPERHEVTTDELHVVWRGEGSALLVELAYSLGDPEGLTFFRTFSEVLEPGEPAEVFTADHLTSMTSLAIDPATSEPYRAVPFDGQRTVYLRVVVETGQSRQSTVFTLVARVNQHSPRFRVEPSWASPAPTPP